MIHGTWCNDMIVSIYLVSMIQHIVHGVMIQSYITNTLKSNVLNDTWCNAIDCVIIILSLCQTFSFLSIWHGRNLIIAPLRIDSD